MVGQHLRIQAIDAEDLWRMDLNDPPPPPQRVSIPILKSPLQPINRAHRKCVISHAGFLDK